MQRYDRRATIGLPGNLLLMEIMTAIKTTCDFARLKIKTEPRDSYAKKSWNI